MRIYAYEFIGLDFKIIRSSSKYLVGLKGKILYETKNTFIVRCGNKLKIIPKKENVFLINLGNKHVEVLGSKICFRPEERIKRYAR